MENLRSKKGFLCDMDGVIYHGNQLLPGVREFVQWLQEEGKSFLFLTNSSERSPLELAQKLSRMGMDVDESHFYTSALATAKFIASQSPRCTAFVIGAPGLFVAFGAIFVLMAVAGAIYQFSNATRKNRFSAFDITDEQEEPDELKQYFGKIGEGYMPEKQEPAARYCPYCGEALQEDYRFCPKCGNELK